ncbi:tetratricopeptide repeat-containing sensor histidine kinase [Tenacibaculum aquimarinum]|uniref:tetratricopeptide repeat-containing sensor histidine kinase n=1 Tax=Tenacibaculum aquimarinum TaxID=2910675 RepID=UPI001F0B5AAD|nr:sensor histidine kinase [Tenacibaculum aquimarinum]MCH3884415.1 sensor histidine kinase [Tenacibaculum aquimarinum]
MKIIKIFIIPLIFLLYSSRINSTNEKADSSSAFSLFTKVNDSIIKNKLNKALSLTNNGNYSESLKIAFNILDESKDVKTIINVNKLLGNIYENINDHKNAIKYFKTTLNLILKNEGLYSETAEDVLENIKAESLLKIGGIYQKIPQLDSAKYYLEQLLSLNSFKKETRLKKADAHTNLSGIHFYYENLKDLKKAKYHANKAIEIHKELNFNQTLAADYGNLASIYMEEDNLIEAKKLYYIALGYVENDNRLKAVKYKEALYDNLGWTLYNLKDYVAYGYLDRSVSIRDSLRDIELNKAIKEIESKHNVEMATKDVEAQKLKAEQNTWLVGIASFSAIALLFYFVNVYKLRQQRLKIKLSENELVQQKNIEKIKSESQIKILNATLDGKEAERKQIAETLHDNVSAMLSSANLHLQASQKQFNGNVPAEIQKTQKIILEASQQIRDLSHNLVSSILLKFGLEYALKDAAENFSNSQINFFTKIEGLNRYDQDFEIKVYNIIQEFSNNIIKHSQANEALIKVEEEDGELNILVEDNGVGFNVEDPINKGGIGLNQINARVTMLQGTFTVESKENEGTKIKITLPIKERKKAFIG